MSPLRLGSERRHIPELVPLPTVGGETVTRSETITGVAFPVQVPATYPMVGMVKRAALAQVPLLLNTSAVKR